MGHSHLRKTWSSVIRSPAGGLKSRRGRKQRAKRGVKDYSKRNTLSKKRDLQCRARMELGNETSAGSEGKKIRERDSLNQKGGAERHLATWYRLSVVLETIRKKAAGKREKTGGIPNVEGKKWGGIKPSGKNL